MKERKGEGEREGGVCVEGGGGGEHRPMLQLKTIFIMSMRNGKALFISSMSWSVCDHPGQKITLSYFPYDPPPPPLLNHQDNHLLTSCKTMKITCQSTRLKSV